MNIMGAQVVAIRLRDAAEAMRDAGDEMRRSGFDATTLTNMEASASALEEGAAQFEAFVLASGLVTP